MSLFDGFRHGLRPLFRRRRFDHEMAEEFRHHLELRAQEFPNDDDPARARFGSAAYYMEEIRRMTPLGWLDVLGQQVRFALRSLRRAPGFTAVAVLSLAMGIGANSAIFGLIYGLLLQPLPVSHARQLVEVQHTGRDLPNDLFSYNEYGDLRRNPGFADLTALGGAEHVAIVAGHVFQSVDVDAVDGNFFATVGLRPLIGRLITPADEQIRAPVVVISDDLWASLFSRAPTAIGATITMEGAAFTVVGVTPKSFQGLGYPGSFEAGIPLSTLVLVGGDAVETSSANAATIRIVGRLMARGAMSRTATTLDATWRSCCAGSATATGIQLVSIEHGISSSKFDVAAMFGRLLFELLGGAAVVLLAACVNISTLLLARGAARERELAVRLSLGASRRRLASQLLVESSLLAAIGGAAGLVMADLALRMIGHRLPGPIVDHTGLQLNGTMLGFTAAAAVVSVLLFGVLPAWRATRSDLVAPLKEGGQTGAARRSGWLDRSMVVGQVAIALILLNAAGLFVVTLRNLRAVNGGFATERTVATWLDARGTSYESSGLGVFADRLLSRVALIPGVRRAALSMAVPVFGGRRIGGDIAIEGYTPSADESMQGWFNPVTPGFFSTLGIGLRMGRDFSPDDRAAGQQVAIVNQAFARQYFHERNPLGAIVRSIMADDTILLHIIGVAGDARFVDLRQPPPPMIFMPLAQFQQIPGLNRIPVLDLVVRTAGDDRMVPNALRNAVMAEAPGLGIGGPETIEASIDAALNRETLTAELATLFGVVALILAAIGLYGIVSYRVAQRTREIGVRMALGSSASSVVWMVLKQALALVTIGVVIGAPLALSAGKVIAAELFGLAGQNRFFVLGAGVVLMGVAVAASALPARRAARVDPLIALRAD